MRTSGKARFFLRSAGALGAIAAVSWGAPALADEVRLSHGGAAVERSARDLGLIEERAAPGEPVVSVRWDRAGLLAACDSLASDLALEPPFEGDIDVAGDTAVPVPPEPGEAVDCAALALRIERDLAGGGPLSIEVPIVAREPRTSAASLEALAHDAGLLLAGPVTLTVTFEGRAAGEVTLAPDDVRAALQVRFPAVAPASGEAPRPEAVLRPDVLADELDPLLAALGEPARDARFVVEAGGRVRVVPGRAGLRLDGAALFAAAGEAAKKADKKGTVTATKGGPDRTTKKAEALRIKGLVASFTTRYTKGQPRVTNIHRIATLLDGAIVEPGDRFSVNHHTGKRTAKRGFVMAPSIGEGEMIETVGGGVSQVATTLYNAVFDAGYAVVSRKPHTRYFDRYPLGVEATLAWPRPDFVFRNDSKTGVLIKASFTDDSVTVKLYGDNEGRKVTRIASKTFAPTDPRTDYEPDETLALSKTKVKDPGTKGFSVKVGRDIVFADGTKKHEERTVVYHGRPRVVVAHPCSFPKGEKGRRKKGCPRPTEREESDALYEELSKPADDKPADADRKAADDKPADRKAVNKKAADRKGADKKTADKKAADRKGADKKAAGTRTADKKAAGGAKKK